MPSKLETAYNLIVKAQKEVQDALQEQSQTITGIFITTKLNEIVNKVSFQLGVAAGGTTPSVQTFEPVTNFMGEEIKRTPAVTEADLTPTPTAKDLYTADVDALQSTFRDRKPETLIQDFTDKPFVLRGVAKRAGLEDYEEGLINIDFIERVKAGLDAMDQRAKEEDAVNAELGFNDNTQDVNPAPTFDGLTAGQIGTQDVPDAVVNKELDPAPKAPVIPVTESEKLSTGPLKKSAKK